MGTVEQNPAPRRKPRFRPRDRKDAPRFGETPRMVAILFLLHEHRFLTTRQITEALALQGYSEQHTGRLLSKMYDARFVDKPEEQLVYRPGTGPKPDTYALGDNGAVYLEDKHGIARRKARWRDKNRAVRHRHVEHGVLSADVSLAFERSCRLGGAARLIGSPEILGRAPEGVREAVKPFRWPVAPEWDGRPLRYAIEPDKLFGLELLLKETRPKVWFVREEDTGSETVTPTVITDRKTNTPFHKFLAYFYTHEHKLLAERFAINNFRVLTLTSKEGTMTRTNPTTGKKETITRMRSLQEAAMKACEGKLPNMFLFAERSTLLSHDDVLSMPWQNAKGEIKLLL